MGHFGDVSVNLGCVVKERDVIDRNFNSESDGTDHAASFSVTTSSKSKPGTASKPKSSHYGKNTERVRPPYYLKAFSQKVRLSYIRMIGVL